MRHGTTLKDLCIRFKVGKAIKLNIYKLVQFLCVHGIIRRIHKVQLNEGNVLVLVVDKIWHNIPETVLREAALRLIPRHRNSDGRKCCGEEEIVRTLRRHQNYGRNLRQHRPLYARINGVL